MNPIQSFSYTQKRVYENGEQVRHVRQKRVDQNQLNTKYQQALQRENVDECRRALTNGAEPTLTDKKGNNALHLAMKCESVELAYVALERNVPVDHLNDEGLSVFSDEKSLPESIMLKLIDHHPEIDKVDKNGNTLLHLLINGNYSTVVVLACIDKCTNPNISNLQGKTPLDLVFDKLDASKTLKKDYNRIYCAFMERGVKLAAHKYDYTILQYSCMCGYYDLAFSALKYGDKFDDVSKNDLKESALVCLYRYINLGIDKTNLIRDFTKYAITVHLPKNKQKLEEYVPYQKCQKIMEDDFLAMALLLLAHTNIGAKDILTEKEKMTLIVRLLIDKQLVTFLGKLLYYPEVRDPIFKWMLNKGLVYSLNTTERKILFEEVLNVFNPSPKLHRALNDLFFKDKNDLRPFFVLLYLPEHNKELFNKYTRKYPDDEAGVLLRILLEKYYLLLDHDDVDSALLEFTGILWLHEFLENPKAEQKMVEQILKKLEKSNVKLGLKDWLISESLDELSELDEMNLNYNQSIVDKNASSITIFLHDPIFKKIISKKGSFKQCYKKYYMYALQSISKNRAEKTIIDFVDLCPSGYREKYICDAYLEGNLNEYPCPDPVPLYYLTKNKIGLEEIFDVLCSIMDHLPDDTNFDDLEIQAMMHAIIPLFGGLKSTKILQLAQESKHDNSQLFLIHFFIRLIIEQRKDKERCSADLVYSLIDRLTDEQFLMFFSQMFHNPLLAKGFNQSMCELHSMEIWDRGRAKNSWEDFTKRFLKRLNKISYARPSETLSGYLVRVQNAMRRKPKPVSNAWFDELKADGWEKLRWQGRTLIFHRKQDGHYLAVKWLKKNENIGELHKEFEVLSILREKKSELQLMSQFPEPKGVYEFVGHLDPSLFLNEGKPVAYIYETTSEDYFIYPQNSQLSDKKHKSMLKINMHDLGVLAAEDLFMVAVADVFHNNERGHQTREDAGRFIPLVGLFQDYFFGDGCGRLSRYLKATEYANLRASGIADVGDSATIKQLNDKEFDLSKRHFSELFKKDRTNSTHPSRGNLFRANGLAEYMQADELIVGARAKQTDTLSWKNDQKMEETAKILKKGPAALISGYLGIPKGVAKDFVNSNGVELKHYAQEMGFWMQNNNNGYLPFLLKQQMPKKLYPKSVKVEMKPTTTFRGWSDQYGFAIDGVNPDLGTVNGPYPVTEGVLNRFISPLYMLIVREAKALAKKMKAEAESVEDLEKVRDRVACLDPLLDI